MKNRLIIAIIAILLIGCSRITKDVKRTQLYEYVVEHYKTIDENREKQAAAQFIFENIRQKYAIYNFASDSLLRIAYDSVQYMEGKEIASYLKEIAIDTIINGEYIFDYKNLGGKELVEHIDITYHNWKQLAVASGATFDDYCNYILPYRTKNECAIPLRTQMLESILMQFVDTLSKTDDIIPIMSEIIKSQDLRIDSSLSEIYTNTLFPKYLDRVKVATSCSDLVIYLTHLIRSIGIPAVYDSTPQWGNHQHLGHSWVSIKWQGEWYGFDAIDGGYVSKLYQRESLPKIYRSHYLEVDGNDVKDITSQYRECVNLSIKVDNNVDYKTLTPAIALFNIYSNYRVIDYGIKENGHFNYNDLGNNAIYFVGGVKDGVFKPITYPIYVDSCGLITKLIPNYNERQSVILHRKYPLTSVCRNRSKLIWAKSLKGSWIEASNDNYINVDTLLILNKFNSYKEICYKIDSKKEYRSIRYRSSPKNQIATLNFFNNNGDQLTGEIVHDLWEGADITPIFDNDMLTWSFIGNDFRFISVGYEFSKPQNISHITIHARNDANHIVIGDNYELMIWNNGWQSLGTQIATTQELEYINIPQCGLYWLRNHSQGSEEIPFMISTENKQFWAGE